ncbi:ribosome silencing factor [Paramylibacter kogurei]
MRYTEDTVLARTVDAAEAANATNIPSMSLLDLVLNSLQDDKAEDIIPIDLSGKSSMADHMVVASGRSSRQVAAISEKLLQRIKETTGIIAKLEGKGTGDWVLVDAGDIIVHVFRPEVREFYQIEKMWLPDEAEPADA